MILIAILNLFSIVDFATFVYLTLSFFLTFFLSLYFWGFIYKLILSLMPSCYDIYWLPRARRYTSGQRAQLVEYLPSDPKIMGSNLDSAPNTLSFKNAKIISLLYFHRIFSRIDSRNLQIVLYIMQSCKTYMFVCLFIATGACSSVDTAWSSHSFGHGFESHLV